MNAVLVSDRQAASARKPRLPAGRPSADESPALLDPKLQRFRIQFAGASPDRGPSILREVEIEASGVSTAIIAAANLDWPPRTIGLRILDREGREVFARQKVDWR
jgi:hypothetical protein